MSSYPPSFLRSRYCYRLKKRCIFTTTQVLKKKVVFLSNLPSFLLSQCEPLISDCNRCRPSELTECTDIAWDSRRSWDGNFSLHNGQEQRCSSCSPLSAAAEVSDGCVDSGPSSPPSSPAPPKPAGLVTPLPFSAVAARRTQIIIAPHILQLLYLPLKSCLSLNYSLPLSSFSFSLLA